MPMIYRTHTVVATTDSSGDATVYDTDDVSGYKYYNGEIIEIRFVDTDLDAGADFTITVEGTGENLWTQDNQGADATKRPLVLAQSVLGIDLTAVYVRPFLTEDRIKIVIANGDNTKSGTFTILVRRQE